MAEVQVALVSELHERDLRVKVVEGREVGLVRLGGEVFAYENLCPHAGGPVCQGRLMARVEELIADDRTSQGLCFSAQQVNIVCPWHGYEYDARTGQHQGQSGLRLARFPVRIDGDRVLVTL